MSKKFLSHRRPPFPVPPDSWADPPAGPHLLAMDTAHHRLIADRIRSLWRHTCLRVSRQAQGRTSPVIIYHRRPARAPGNGLVNTLSAGDRVLMVGNRPNSATLWKKWRQSSL